MCISFAACSSKADETELTETLSPATESTADTGTKAGTSDSDEAETIQSSTEKTTEAATEKKNTTTTKKTTAKARGSDDTSISLNEALDVLTDFYGSTYNVNATVVEDGWQYFSVTDKRGTKYASVKVDLSTADAVETIIATGEVNEYNLLV